MRRTLEVAFKGGHEPRLLRYDCGVPLCAYFHRGMPCTTAARPARRQHRSEPYTRLNCGSYLVHRIEPDALQFYGVSSLRKRQYASVLQFQRTSKKSGLRRQAIEIQSQHEIASDSGSRVPFAREAAPQEVLSADQPVGASKLPATFDEATEPLLLPSIQPGDSGNDFHTTQPYQLISWYPRSIPKQLSPLDMSLRRMDLHPQYAQDQPVSKQLGVDGRALVQDVPVPQVHG